MYEKSVNLLASMAMRASHDFGLKDSQAQQVAMDEMSHLYDLFALGQTNEEINKEVKFGVVTIRQIREEVDGSGFFNPDR